MPVIPVQNDFNKHKRNTRSNRMEFCLNYGNNCVCLGCCCCCCCSCCILLWKMAWPYLTDTSRSRNTTSHSCCICFVFHFDASQYLNVLSFIFCNATWLLISQKSWQHNWFYSETIDSRILNEKLSKYILCTIAWVEYYFLNKIFFVSL